MRGRRKESHWPLASVVIPTHNRSGFLCQAVESALAQTYPNVEVIVIDDGSTDDTADAMARYDSRVHYIRQANRGVAAARNAGIRVAKGDYLSFLDDDDLFCSHKIERQVQLLRRQPDAGLIHCRYCIVDQDGSELYRAGILKEGDVLRELLYSNFVWMGAPLMRRTCLDSVGLFDEKVPAVTADWDMWLRIAQAGYRFACAQELLGAYRAHQDSMMGDVAELERGVLVVLEKAFARLPRSADTVAQQKRTYTKIHLWIGWSYYEAGQWEEACRSLSTALSLCPQLGEQPTALMSSLCSHALSTRVRDSLSFVTKALDHLPEWAACLQEQRLPILGFVTMRLALRTYGLGHTACARTQLGAAIALDPHIAEGETAFADALVYSARHLPIDDPIGYVETVLGNLPGEAHRLAGVRSRVLGKVNLDLARQEHLVDRRMAAMRRILRAVRYQPRRIKALSTWSLVYRILVGRNRGGIKAGLGL